MSLLPGIRTPEVLLTKSIFLAMFFLDVALGGGEGNSTDII